MGKSEERRPPESGREPGENTAVAGLIMGIAAVVDDQQLHSLSPFLSRPAGGFR